MSAGKWPSLDEAAKRLGLNLEDHAGDYQEGHPFIMPDGWPKEEMIFATHDGFGHPIGYAGAVRDAKRKSRGKKASRQ